MVRRLMVSTLFVLGMNLAWLSSAGYRWQLQTPGLRDNGKTLLGVEHEEAVIRAADSLIEIGPGRGRARSVDWFVKGH